MKRTLPQHIAATMILGRNKADRLLRDLGQDGTAGRWLVFDMKNDNEWLFACKTEAGANRLCAAMNRLQSRHIFDYEVLPAGKHRKVSLSAIEAGLKTQSV
jgi:hypothetical protein